MRFLMQLIHFGILIGKMAKTKGVKASEVVGMGDHRSSDYRRGAIEISLYSLIPSAENLRTSSTACYEYLSRMRYGIF